MKKAAKKEVKSFDAVAFMRKQRDRISKDIIGMDLEQMKAYFRKGNKSLNKYENKILFPEKLEVANKILKKVGLPKPNPGKKAIAK